MFDESISKLLSESEPMRSFVKYIIQHFEIGTWKLRMNLGCIDRQHYAYCVLNAALLGKKLGHHRISVIEFGVAGGEGLVNLEYHVREIRKLLDMEIEIYGFDSGKGLPESVDYRDLPYHWKKGFFKMDFEKLKNRLTFAHLVIGDLNDTIKAFFNEFQPAPIGAILFDLDYYSSTSAALAIFESDHRNFLPRLFCYFDDIIGTELELHNDFTGERLAINEFNRDHDNIKFSIPYYMFAKKKIDLWLHKIRICHLFSHPQYNTFISTENQQLPCDSSMPDKICRLFCRRFSRT